MFQERTKTDTIAHPGTVHMFMIAPVQGNLFLNWKAGHPPAAFKDSG